MKKLFSLLSIVLMFAHLQAGENTAIIQPGERIVGARLALGSVYGASAGVIVSGEYGYKENLVNLNGIENNLGLGASIGYSGYSEKYSVGTYSYSNILISGSALWHVALINDPRLDTYLTLNLGWNIVSVSIPTGGPDYGTSYDGLVWGTGIGARFHFNDKLAAVGELGFGMGVLRLGIDYSL